MSAVEETFRRLFEARLVLTNVRTLAEYMACAVKDMRAEIEGASDQEVRGMALMVLDSVESIFVSMCKSTSETNATQLDAETLFRQATEKFRDDGKGAGE